MENNLYFTHDANSTFQHYARKLYENDLQFHDLNHNNFYLFNTILKDDSLDSDTKKKNSFHSSYSRTSDDFFKITKAILELFLFDPHSLNHINYINTLLKFSPNSYTLNNIVLDNQQLLCHKPLQQSMSNFNIILSKLPDHYKDLRMPESYSLEDNLNIIKELHSFLNPFPLNN